MKQSNIIPYLKLITPLLLLFLAGAANGVMDTLQFHYPASVFAKLPENYQQWFNPQLSWVNKWQVIDGKVVLKERFWGSSSIFVVFTDAWHTAKWIFLNFTAVAFSWIVCILTENFTLKALFIVFFVLKVLFALGFWLFYDVLL